MALNHQRSGSGEPLLLIHGIGSELCMWDPVLEPLAEHHDVIAVDLPGFGGSPPLPDDVVPSPPNLARAVAGLINELGAQDGPVHVAGNSLGGWVALELGRMNVVATVTCLSPAGLWGAPVTRHAGPTKSRARRLARALRPILPLLMLSPRVRALALGAFVAHPERVPRRAATRMVASYGRATAYEATSYAMRSSHLERSEEITVPITIGWGDQDRLLRPVHFHAVGVEETTLRGCGHLPTWDDPRAVTELILEGARRSPLGAAGAASAT